MDQSKKELAAVVQRLNHLEQLNGILYNEKKTVLSRRLAIEHYRQDFVELGATSLEDADKLKKLIGIAMMVAGFTIMASAFGSLNSTSSDVGTKIAKLQEETNQQFQNAMSLLTGVTKDDSLKFLTEEVFKGDAKAADKAKLAYEAFEKSDPIKLALYMGNEHRGITPRKVFGDYEKLKKFTLACTVWVKLVTDGVAIVTYDLSNLSTAFTQDDQAKFDEVAKKIQDFQAKVLSETHANISDDGGDSDNTMATTIASINESFREDPDLDIDQAAANLKKLLDDSQTAGLIDDFNKSFAKLVSDKDAILKKLEAERGRLEKQQQAVTADKKDPAAFKTAADLCKGLTRLVNVLSNADKTFSNILKGLGNAKKVAAGIVEYIRKKGKNDDGTAMTKEFTAESYRDDVVAIEELLSRLPTRGISTESFAGEKAKHIDLFEFAEQVNGISDYIKGDRVDIGWSMESLAGVRAYCTMTGIKTLSSFNDNFVDRGLAIEDLSMAKKIGAVLAIIASFGGLYALWKRYKSSKDGAGDSAATAEVSSSHQNATETVNTIAAEADDLATQIEKMSFTGEDADKNRKAVLKLSAAFRTIGINEDAENHKKLAEVIRVMGKEKMDGVFAKMAEYDNLGVLGSEFVVKGPVGKGANQAHFTEFFKKCETVTAFLKALAKSAVESCDVYDTVVKKLGEATVSKTDVAEAMAIVNKHKEDLKDDNLTQAIADFEKYAGVNTEGMGINQQMRALLGVIRDQFQPSKEPKNIAAGVAELVKAQGEMAAFQQTFSELRSEVTTDSGLRLETMDKKNAHFKTETFQKAVATANENLKKLEGLSDQEKDLVNHLASQVHNRINACKDASAIVGGVNQNVSGFVRRIVNLENGMKQLSEAFTIVGGGSVSNEAYREIYDAVRLPPGLSLEVFDDDSYLEFTDDEFDEDLEHLEEDANLLLGDAIAVEQWVEDIRKARGICGRDVLAVEHYCPGLITERRPINTFTSFRSGTNYHLSLEEGSKLATGMKIAAVVALAALAVRSAMWLKKKYEMSTNSLSAISHLKDDLDKKIKNADAKAVQLRQLCETEGVKKQEIDVGDGIKFNTGSAESEIKALRDKCIAKALQAKGWNKLMEEAIDPSSNIFKVYEPLRVFVHQNLDPMNKTMEQVKAQMNGGQGGVSAVQDTEWKGINDLERAVGGGIVGLEACAGQIETMTNALKADGATPKNDAKDMTWDGSMKSREAINKQVDGNDTSVEKTLEKFLKNAQDLETAATKKGGSGETNGAVESARSAQANLKQLKLAVAQFAGLSMIYLNYYQALDQAVGYYDNYITAAIKKCKSDK